ncbi:MAG: hypothetical protein OEZ34_02430, partial [Spirochaetia bacterium]|nr:hypothetical protein [Spirochaetia bacterium]
MMNSELELDKRISVLEKSMEWAQSSVQKIDKDLDIIKNTQYQLIEKMSDFKTETEQKFHEVNERFTLLHADMEIKISSFRSEILERMTQQQAHNDER